MNRAKRGRLHALEEVARGSVRLLGFNDPGGPSLSKGVVDACLTEGLIEADRTSYRLTQEGRLTLTSLRHDLDDYLEDRPHEARAVSPDGSSRFLGRFETNEAAFAWMDRTWSGPDAIWAKPVDGIAMLDRNGDPLPSHPRLPHGGSR